MAELDAPPAEERAQHAFANDVLDGLTKPFKELPPKYLYDARGSELFDAITEQPEYYPTRAELRILRDRAGEIVARTGAGELVELGAGASTKARVLLDAMRAAGTLRRYVSLDVSEVVVASAAGALAADLPVDAFEHVAFYDRRQEWVEMRLRATRPCSAYLAALDLRVEFAAGEELRTEISAKFTPARVRGDLEASGLKLAELLTDPEELFAISLSRPA